jgi:hypothetical protein
VPAASCNGRGESPFDSRGRGALAPGALAIRLHGGDNGKQVLADKKEETMCRLATLATMALALAASARAGDLDDFSWPQDVGRVERWTPQPPWVSDPSPTANATGDGRTVCFAVNEPGRGMKWSAPLPAVSLAEFPWLVVRYRAENLDTTSADYLLYLDDRTPKTQLHALRLGDARSDGQWHTAAVDVGALTRAEAVTAMAVQVQANRQGKARLWLDSISFRDEAPKEATIIARAAVPPKADWTAPRAAMKWTAQNAWLGNPAADGGHRVERTAEQVLFRVDEPGRGMKWSADLPEPVPLDGHRYASMRYCGWRTSPDSDYALCALGRPRPGGPDYVTLVPSAELIADGRWHTLDVDLRDAAQKLATVTRFAVQVQAAGPGARLEVSDLRLSNVRQPARLADSLDVRVGVDWSGFQPVPIRAQATGRSEAWRSRLRLGDWFTGPVTAEQIPFDLPSQPPDLAVTPLRAKSQLRIPVGKSASEVYLLLLAAMTGQDEPVYGSGRLQAIRDVDRFRLRLEYADGTADECLPLNVATKQFGAISGPQVLVAPAAPEKRLEAAVLCDATRQAAFGVAAVTIRTGRGPLHPEAADPAPRLRLRNRSAGLQGAAGNGPPGRLRPENETLEAVLASQGPPTIQRLVHRPTDWNYLAGPRPLVELRVDGKAIAPSDIEPLAAGSGPAEARWYRVRSVDGLRLGVTATGHGDSLAMTVELHNGNAQAHRVALIAPSLTYRLAERPEDAFYLVPKRGAALDCRDGSYRERYCGTFPVQFLDTFSPALGRGLSLRTEDTECVRKNYLLAKQAANFTLGVEYPEQTLGPGQRFHTPRTVLTATDGDWRRGLDAYRRWLATWHRPLSARKPWFREVFNFRQRFLWSSDPLYDAGSGTLHLDRAIDEARREFGGIEYLHLFDWGNCGPYGRIYGRTGDYSPYDYLRGGRDSLRKAIGGVQSQSVPVGLYIEGYLLEERGKLGSQFGRSWQSIGPDGKGRYWPQSTEMFMCAGVPAWQELQAETYATKVRELGVDGMYLDEFGFAGENQDCWSKEHGHAVPSYAAAAERDGTRAVRLRIDRATAASPATRGVALYTEESPVDVTSQYQDGSFTYAMFSAQRSSSLVPLNLTRFAFPDFKTIEILYCDGPTGSWSTGVKWTFFNGEAIWLEGPAAEWFEPETREAVRRCHSILRRHRDAFTTLRPVALAPTEQGGVYANEFPSEGKTVYTFYNARRVTVRGPVLRLPHLDKAAYYDEWNTRAVRVDRSGSDDLLWLELGPCDVGCVVVRP